MSQLSLFISCVSSEFGHYRDAMRKDFNRPNLATKIQEDFVAYGTSTLQKLDEYIQQCEAVIHICGSMTGSMAHPSSNKYINDTYKDFGERFPELLPVLNGSEQMSYTQWEAWLAAYHNRILIIATPGEKAHRHSEERPHAEQQEHQQLHLSRLKGQGHYNEVHFNNQDNLINQIYKSKLFDLFSRLSPVKPINLPYHSIGKLFKGRESELKKIYKKFKEVRSKPTAIIGDTIHGLGGVGKTRLAVEYARRYETDYTALLFVTADSPEKLFSNLAAFSAQPVLDLPEQHAKEEQLKYDAVIQWLKHHTGWLLILDNVDSRAAAAEVHKLFGQLAGGHVLITSRQANWSNQVNSLSLGILDEHAATSFLLDSTGKKRRKTEEDKSLAKLIAEDLGYLALALEQAGAYIITRRLIFAEYRAVWQTNNSEVLEWYDELVISYPKSVATTWQTSVSQLSADAKRLLDRLAWLAPDPIPESLLKVQVTEEENANFRIALSELEAYSLVNRSNTPEFTIHRLVQDVTRRNQDKELAKKTFTICLNWIDDAFTGDPADIGSWPVLEPLIPHALTLIDQQAVQSRKAASDSRLMNQLAVLLLTKAQHTKAEPLMRRALQIDEQSFGVNHPDVAIDLNNLAQLLQATNRMGEAEPLMRRAFAIYLSSFDFDHPNTQKVGINYVLLLQAIGRNEEEIEMMLSGLIKEITR